MKQTIYDESLDSIGTKPLKVFYDIGIVLAVLVGIGGIVAGMILTVNVSPLFLLITFLSPLISLLMFYGLQIGVGLIYDVKVTRFFMHELLNNLPAVQKTNTSSAQKPNNNN